MLSCFNINKLRIFTRAGKKNFSGPSSLLIVLEIAMPYQKLDDLPDSVQNNLPTHAQEIYRAAFNNAWKEYSHDETRSHKVAWSAVKKTYRRDGTSGEWDLK
jgi:cation transport regulator